jgi:hypothetical protein
MKGIETNKRDEISLRKKRKKVIEMKRKKVSV